MEFDGSCIPQSSIALLLNSDSAGGFESGEASLVGLDADGNAAPGTDGSFVWDGQVVPVDRNQVTDGNNATRNYTLLTQTSFQDGFIAFDTSGSAPFRIGVDGTTFAYSAAAFVWEEEGQWKYDQNLGGEPVNWVPSNTVVALGWLRTGESDVLEDGGLYAQARLLNEGGGWKPIENGVVPNSNPSAYWSTAVGQSGESVVIWTSASASGGPGSLLLQRYDSLGQVIGDTIIIDDRGENGWPAATYLENGSIAVSYWRYVSGYRQTELRILNASDEVVHASVASSGTATGDYLGRDIFDLGNEQIFVVWSYSENHPQLPHIRQEGQRFSYDGEKIGEPVVIAQSGSGSIGLGPLERLADGSFLAIIGDSNFGNRFDLIARRIDPYSGDIFESSLIDSVEGSQKLPAYAVAELDDRIIVFWRGADSHLYGKAILGDGSLGQKTLVAHQVSGADVVALGNQVAVLFHNDYGSNSAGFHTFSNQLVPSSAATFHMFDEAGGVRLELLKQGKLRSFFNPAYNDFIYFIDLERTVIVEPVLDGDGDGVPDSSDAFPFDPAASVDTDGDGMPNDWNPGKFAGDSTSQPPLELDYDDDNDGYEDSVDVFPLDPSEWADCEGDGIGDNADTDDDNDGIPDTQDAFPCNPAYSQDSDGDGIPDTWELQYGLDPLDPRDAYYRPGSRRLSELGRIPNGARPISL